MSAAVTNGLATRIYAASLTNGLQLVGAYVTSSITNGLALPSVTNGLALNSQLSTFVTGSITNGLATRIYAASLTNGLQLAGAYVTSSVTNGLALPSVTNGLQIAGAYVTASVTNGLALNSQLSTLVTGSITNGLATRTYAASLTNGLQLAGAYVTSSITNGLARPAVTNGLQIAGAYVTSSVTNGLALPSVTNGLQIAGAYTTATVTNGLATRTYAASLTNGFYLASNPSGYVSATVTNGLVGAELDPLFQWWLATNTYVTSLGGYLTGYQASNSFMLATNNLNLSAGQISNLQSQISSLTNGLIQRVTGPGLTNVSGIAVLSTNGWSFPAAESDPFLTAWLATNGYIKASAITNGLIGSVTGPGFTVSDGVATLSTNSWAFGGGTGGLTSNDVTTAAQGLAISNLAATAYQNSGAPLKDALTVVSIGVSNRVLVSAATTAAHFNGSSYAASPDGISMVNGTSNGTVTIEAWINPDNLTDTGDGFVALYTHGGTFYGSEVSYYSLLIQTNGALAAYLKTLSGNHYVTATNTTTLVQTGVWQHVAMVFAAGGTVKFYVGGTNTSTEGSLSSLENDTSTGADSIGVWRPGDLETFTGYLSELRVVANDALYTSNFTPSPCLPSTTNVVGYWRMRAGSGNTLTDSVGALTVDTSNGAGTLGWLIQTNSGACAFCTNANISTVITNVSVDWQNHTLGSGWGVTTNIGFLNLATNASTLFITNGLLKGVSTP